MASTQQRCVFLGLGNMGGALCRRLCKQGVGVLGLDIDAAKVAALAKDFGVTPADNIEHALTHPEWKDAPVFICLPTYTLESNLLFPVGKLLQGRVLLSMCSGDPDQVCPTCVTASSDPESRLASAQANSTNDVPPLLHAPWAVAHCLQARAFFAELKEKCDVDTYVDGCHVGSPLLAAEGKGLVMVSCDRPRVRIR